jgi:hypothetical protein
MSFFLDNIDIIFWVSSVATVIILLVKPPRLATRSEAIRAALHADAYNRGILAEDLYRYHHSQHD